MASIKITTKTTTNLKGFNKLVKGFKKEYDAVAQVGHFGGKQHADPNLTIAEVSYINQKGLGRVPKRPYMEIAMTSPAFIKAYKASQIKVSKEIIGLSVSKGSRGINPIVSQEVKLLAKLLEEIMVGVIETSTGLVANRPDTIAEKGSSTPLIDTTTMVDDITNKFIKDLKVNHTSGVERTERSG